jgi:hypothetical protein
LIQKARIKCNLGYSFRREARGKLKPSIIEPWSSWQRVMLECLGRGQRIALQAMPGFRKKL